MKKLFTFLVYAITLATPALIIQYYHHFVQAMSPEEIRMSTIVGTGATLLMAMIYGFGTRRPRTFNAARVKNARIAGNGEIIVKDPGAHG
ncbi:MAG: hypothetical protein IJM79_08760, partial [Erysipelotrichaceae bacterium]|nr:hypothetical protein [Erysipelotrichaceae bacterium]